MRPEKKPAGDDFPRVKKPIVGNRYHVSWAYRGARWDLVRIYPDGNCLLVAPKSMKTLVTKCSDLRELGRKEI